MEEKIKEEINHWKHLSGIQTGTNWDVFVVGLAGSLNEEFRTAYKQGYEDARQKYDLTVSHDKVYVVTSGDYSDYSIDAVFSTKPKAEEYNKRALMERSGWGSSVETWRLDEPIPENGITVQMDYNFNVLHSQIYFGKEAGFRCFDWGGDYLFWNVQTLDKKRAIKVTSEKVTQILALGLWGKDKEVLELFKGFIQSGKPLRKISR